MEKIKKENVYCDDNVLDIYQKYPSNMFNDYYGLNNSKESNLFVDVCTRIAYEKYGLIVDYPEMINNLDCLKDAIKYLELVKEKKDIENNATQYRISESSYEIEFWNHKEVKKYMKILSKISDIEQKIYQKKYIKRK